jgi:hypothetical protein
LKNDKVMSSKISSALEDEVKSSLFEELEKTSFKA